MKNTYIHHITYACAWVLLTVACSGSEEQGTGTVPANTPDQAIAFATEVEETAPTTRAYQGTIDDVGVLKTVPEGFGVIAYLTDDQTWDAVKATASPDFMYNQPVRWDWQVRKTKTENGIEVPDEDNSIKDWVYSPLKYWPNSTDNVTPRYISFFAYAPFIERAAMGTTGITDMTNSIDKSPYLEYKMDEATGSVNTDLLWAEPCINATRNGNGLIYFEGTTERWQKVPLAFHHALAAVEVYVQRVYDEPVYSGNKPDKEEHTKLFVSELKLATTNTTTKGLFTGGRLDLQTGTWSSPTGTDAWAAGDKTLTYGEATFNDVVRGTTSSELAVVRDVELNKWGEGYNSATDSWSDDYGVDEEERLLFTNKAITLLPSGGEVTITPTLLYSMVTRDDDLLLSTLTDKDGHKYSRIVNTVAGNALTLNIERGKKYRLVIRIGAEHVTFEVVSVTDWDFPMRFDPNSIDAMNNEDIPHTINED